MLRSPATCLGRSSPGSSEASELCVASDNVETASSSVNPPKGFFLNTTAAAAQEPNEGTYVFEDRWEVIDHTIMSRGYFNNTGLRCASAREHLCCLPTLHQLERHSFRVMACWLNHA